MPSDFSDPSDLSDFSEISETESPPSTTVTAPPLGESNPQLRATNPIPIHKRAAAATAVSPLLSFDVSGFFT
ncbi:MAG: hypothetical protein K2L22_07540 [Muribaculaceae bacterium]|nr:hypothetical protein [Muribaculaceae bacterium]